MEEINLTSIKVRKCLRGGGEEGGVAIIKHGDLMASLPPALSTTKTASYFISEIWADFLTSLSGWLTGSSVDPARPDEGGPGGGGGRVRSEE